MQMTGILVAGGKSIRMKQDKGFVHFDGKPMAQHGIELLKHFFSDCRISANNKDYETFGLPLIADTYTNIGPMGGIHACLSSIQKKYMFLLGCDLPNINEGLISRLLEETEGYEIVLPVHSPNQLEPLCGIYSKSILKQIELMIKDKNYKLHNLIVNCKTKYVNVDDLLLKNPRLFDNINTPAQLQ